MNAHFAGRSYTMVMMNANEHTKCFIVGIEGNKAQRGMKNKFEARRGGAKDLL